MTSKLKKAIGAVKDQTSIGLAKVVSTKGASSSLEVTILKATTHDDVPIDDRYVDEVVHLVSSNKAHASACARALGKRIGRTRNWIVATKSLMLVFRIFQDGDPYFPREVLLAMKRGAKILNLAGFRDDSDTKSPWDFTAFVRTFSLYLDERLECFLTGKLQRRFTRRPTRESPKDHDDEPVRAIKPAMLIDKISYWQRLLERAIATRPTGAAKMNLLVQISFYAIVQESFEVYKDVSDGLALLVDSFFHLHYQNCANAFQICVKAAKQFKELSDFYTFCKSIGVGRASEYPSVQVISEEVIETLQKFLKDQSSLQSRALKPRNEFPPLPGPRPSSRVESKSRARYEMASSQSTSLQDLINATETGTCAPAISIDLEAYSAPQRDDAFRMSNRLHSTRSLPLSISMTDIGSLADWSEQDESEPQKAFPDSSADSENWELVLAATISSSSSPQAFSDNNNTLNAYPQHTSKVEENHSNVGWELVLFESAPPPPLQLLPKATIPPNNHYNPFLQDPFEPSSMPNVQPVASPPTFQAVPAFSAQTNLHDPFDAPFCDSFSAGNAMFSSSMNLQNLYHEQQLWLQNQNKIIAKHMA